MCWEHSLRNLISYESILQALVNETALPKINTAVVRMPAKGMQRRTQLDAFHHRLRPGCFPTPAINIHSEPKTPDHAAKNQTSWMMSPEYARICLCLTQLAFSVKA